MKVQILLFAILYAVALGYVSSMPTSDPEDVAAEDNIYDDLVNLVKNQPERADRHARATCDLLSVSTPWGSLNHAACAAHCLAMNRGYRGGRCMDGVCHCRR